MTLRKVTSTSTIVNEKKFGQVPRLNRHVSSPNWAFFLPLVTHLPSENSILSNFSSPRGVAILGCESHSQAGSATKLRRCASQLETLCRKSLGQINQPLWPKLSPNYMLMSIFFIWLWMVDCKTIDSMAMVRWSKTIEKPLIPMVQTWQNNW